MTPEVVNGLFALGGAALGAVLTGGISIYQSKKNKKRKELTVLTSRVSRLIEVDSSISPVVTITVSGQNVPSVYTFDITLLNSGNETLENTEVSSEISGDAEIWLQILGLLTLVIKKKNVVL